MKKRGGEYAGLDIPEFYEMVEELFTPDEALINNSMPRGPFTAETLLEDLEMSSDKIERILDTMADKGLCVALNLVLSVIVIAGIVIQSIERLTICGQVFILTLVLIPV